MELGFETVGNATIICHDETPVLVTDPWVTGSAYFGSWGMSHEIPAEQMESITRCAFVWASHGHPDHLNPDSIGLFKDKVILLPDHVGGRIKGDLEQQGFRVRVLPTREWVPLSPRVRIMCLPDYGQDAILLIDIGGRLVVNLNDTGGRGWARFIRRMVKGWPSATFLLGLSGFYDTDMINYFTEDGARISPRPERRLPIGKMLSDRAELYGTRFNVPFSSMHRYQRTDSVWAREFTTDFSEFADGWSSTTCENTTPFVRYDCLRDRLEPIPTRETEDRVVKPEDFGDHWDEPLEPADVRALDAYFRRVQHLSTVMGFLAFRVGGKEHRIELNRDAPELREKGITFEVPRGSLMTAVQYEIFDDLLIGNFMKTTMHGEWGPGRIYPDFGPYVAKYSDNGRARTPDEIKEYLRAYRRRDPIGLIEHRFEQTVMEPAKQKVSALAARTLRPDSRLYRAARTAYWGVRKRVL